MPKLPAVRSRQSRVSGQTSQVAGALIPDNTQHSWRDDVGKVLKVLASRLLGVRITGRLKPISLTICRLSKPRQPNQPWLYWNGALFL